MIKRFSRWHAVILACCVLLSQAGWAGGTRYAGKAVPAWAAALWSGLQRDRERAEQVLKSVVAHGVAADRYAALFCLTQESPCSGDVVDLLFERCEDPDPMVVRLCLGKLLDCPVGAGRAAGVVLRSLAHPDAGVRRIAARYANDPDEDVKKEVRHPILFTVHRCNVDQVLHITRRLMAAGDWRTSLQLAKGFSPSRAAVLAAIEEQVPTFTPPFQEEIRHQVRKVREEKAPERPPRRD